MKILVLGKGKTGSIVAETARLRGHNVTSIGSEENPSAAFLTQEKLNDTDVVIDFTTPTAVIENISACTRARKNMVVGTTGWYGELEYVRQLADTNRIGFLYGSNFSVGVNVFFEVARAASTALKLGYTAKIMERHHEQKKDAPSGTAVSIQKILAATGHQPEITSIREGETVGTHVMLFDGPHDTMMLVHDAKSRQGFAEGAVRAAEWIYGKHGFFEFHDIFRELS
ncbi:MAG TPA: dihydrodipicolinate reductase C-terminal domain-containing protein [Terriglobales bacterium]|nr:dihydrodipicolinate reductase C-terminal domain-containing protein [Terriglobales bacterium]